MKIKNFSDLTVNDSRRVALEIADVGLEAIDTKKVIVENIRLEAGGLRIKDKSFPLGKGRIFVFGVGKCSLDAASALEEILGDKIFGGAVIGIRPEARLKKIKYFQGDHPLPSQKNVAATSELITGLKGLTENDLVLMVVSGGGSALLCQPNGFGVEEEINLTENLLKSGADIKEINTIRKHISLARGGNLAKYAYPAKVVSLIFSDVPGGALEFISSGPAVLDSTTIADAKIILAKHGLNFNESWLAETPKDPKYFEKVENILLVSNQIALEAMAEKARGLGYNPQIKTAVLTGEAQEVAVEILNELHRAGSKDILLYGGETTVTVKHNGKGGRNQELALAALEGIKAGELILPFSSDGRDNTDSAGAICDIITKEKAQAAGLEPEDYLERNDSYNFFVKTGDQVVTGSTGSNISDLIIAVKE